MPKQLEWFKEQFEKRYTIKAQWLGPGEQHAREIKILNRIVGWDNLDGIIFEADPRHSEIIIKQLKLDDATVVATRGIKEEGDTIADCDEPLEESQATQHRAITARCNHIAPGRPDLAFSVKELARRMAKPTKGDWLKLKKLGLYLLNKPWMQQVYPWQDVHKTLKTYTDANWAGCRESRTFTIGGCVTLGVHTLKGRSKTQALIALSSGEPEFYATPKASAETLGMVALMKDLGYHLSG